MVDTESRTTFPGNLNCLHNVNQEMNSQYSSYLPQYNGSLYSTAWPKMKVSGYDIKVKEIILDLDNTCSKNTLLRKTL